MTASNKAADISERRKQTRSLQAVREAAGDTVRRVYTDEEIELGITYLAMCAGSPKRASEMLEREEGLRIKAETLKYWKFRRHAERYTRVAQDISPRINQLIAEDHQALSNSAAEVEAKALEQISKRIEAGEDIEVKDLSNIAKNAAISSGIHVDKQALLTGQPTSINATASLTELTRALASKGITVELEGEAVEIQDDDD